MCLCWQNEKKNGNYQSNKIWILKSNFSIKNKLWTTPLLWTQDVRLFRWTKKITTIFVGLPLTVEVFFYIYFVKSTTNIGNGQWLYLFCHFFFLSGTFCLLMLFSIFFSFFFSSILQLHSFITNKNRRTCDKQKKQSIVIRKKNTHNRMLSCYIFILKMSNTIHYDDDVDDDDEYDYSPVIIMSSRIWRVVVVFFC